MYCDFTLFLAGMLTLCYIYSNSTQPPMKGCPSRASRSLDFRMVLKWILSLFVMGTIQAKASDSPDLLVTAVDTSAVVTDCQSLALGGTAVAVVRNTGTGGTGSAFQVLFFEDRNGNHKYDAGVDAILGSVSQGTLAAGAEALVSSPLTGHLLFSGNLIYALADSEEAVAETDETNNYSNSGLGCEYKPVPGSFAPILEWKWTSSSVMSDYLNVMMTPSVVDLNGDGVPDVVFGATSSRGGGYVEVGVLRALSGANGAELFTVTDSNLRVNTAASVAVGDIDLDGHPEILACDDTGARLMAFEHDGTFKWRSPSLEAIYWGAPALADVDQDGTPEIVIGRQVLNADGTVRWTGTGGRSSPSNVGPISCVADVDLDGSPEVIAGNTVYRANGTIWWQAAVPDGHNAVANFDADPFPEIVLVASGYVWVLEHTGAVKWGPVAIPGGGAGGPPTVADYDNDGEVEIGVAGASRYAVFETNGTLKWAAVTQDQSSNRTGSSVFDFEGDGSAEVVYRDELKLRVYRGTDGAVLFETPMSSCTWHEYVLVADVDGDGNAEIVAVANDNCGYGPQRGVYVFGGAHDSWVTTRKIWNQHAYHITNINDDGTVPAVEANNWESFNNYRQNVQTGISVFAAPDLTVSVLRIDARDCPDTAGLVARIGNGGANVAAAPVNVSFYLGDPNVGGLLLGVAQTSVSLKPGEYEDVGLVLDPAPAGPLDVCVVADDDGLGGGALSECNEINNQCCARLPIVCECVDTLVARPKSGKIQLVWQPVGTLGYAVYRGTIAGGPYLKIAYTESSYSTYLDDLVVNGTEYHYVVRPVAVTGDEVCQSNEANATAVGRR